MVVMMNCSRCRYHKCFKKESDSRPFEMERCSEYFKQEPQFVLNDLEVVSVDREVESIKIDIRRVK